MKIEKQILPKSEVEFKIVVDEKDFEKYRERGFKNVQEKVEVDGFRKGKAPEDIIIQKYGEMVILEEMAHLALQDAYIKAIADHKIIPITEPKVTITKLAKGNPLEVSMVVPVMPEVKLPAYKKIAKNILGKDEKIIVTDKDIQDVLEELRKGRAHEHEHVHHEGHAHAHSHNHDEKNNIPDSPETQAKPALPELNNAFAQSFGENFKTIDDLKAKVGENLKLEKEQKAKEKRRIAIMDKILEETKVDLPDVVVEGELSSMLAQMKHDVTRFGGTWEDYLTQSKKTEEEIKVNWRKDAVKRATSQVILHKIADAEKLQATDEEIEVELVRLLTQIQDADENRAKSYLYQVLTNEKVLKFLEKIN